MAALAHVWLAAGGTGGHMFPAQSLAETCLTRGVQVSLATDARGAQYTGGFPQDVTQHVTGSGSFARGGVVAKLMVPFKILAGTCRAILTMRRTRPDVVVGFGGYPAIPSLLAAMVLGIPRVIHEQNGVLGRVNKLFAPHVRTIATGVPIDPDTLPMRVRDKIAYIGNPVRKAVLCRAGAGYIPPGDYPMAILVIGGSQAARLLSQNVPEALALLPEGVRAFLTVSHQARAEDHDDVVDIYTSADIRAHVQPFFDDLPKRMAEAQLVIARAGASTLADLGVIGRPSILVPLAIAMDDHQRVNAQSFSDAYAAHVVREDELTPQRLAQYVQEILNAPDVATQMAAAAQSLGRPTAAQDLADLLESVIKG